MTGRGADAAIQRRQAMRKSGLLAAILFSIGLGLAAAQAQNFPDKVIKLIVPYVPGSPVDVLARVISQQVSTRLGQNVIIENRPGAGTSTATKAVAGASPDGYTLLMSGQALAYVGTLYPDLGLDPLKAFAPVATLAGWSHVLVVAPDVPAKTMPELVAYAKANPGKLTFGFGLGTSPQIIGEYFKAVAGVDVVSVPYRGGEQVRIDLLGGRIHINFAPVSNVLAMIQQGQIRALAVTSATRDANLPDVPTMTESGYPQVGFHPDVWQGVVAPAGTPDAIVSRLNAEINESIKSADVLAALAKLGFNPMTGSPQDFKTFLAAQTQKWPPVLKAANVQPQ
jgi:tripartite-type tricarboxylate transporter receptor subunit TctC